MSGRRPRTAAGRFRRRPSGPGVLLALVLVAALGGCERESRTTLTGNPVHGRDLARLTIGRSTEHDVERVLGPPDERTADGALVYRASAVQRRTRRVGGITWDATEEVVGWRRATFRFTDGVLARVCRERS